MSVKVGHQEHFCPSVACVFVASAPSESWVKVRVTAMR